MMPALLILSIASLILAIMALVGKPYEKVALLLATLVLVLERLPLGK